MKKNIFSVLKLSLYFGIFLTYTTLLSQNTIRGKITTNTGIPLPGTNVLEKETKNGTLTDFDGNYILENVKDNATLIFSYVGFRPIEVPINTRSEINVVLEPDSENLEEVIVIGYGTSSKKDLTSAISSVSTKDFEQQPIIRVENALQARAAGVSVTNATGAAGGDIKIRIRGSNSINFSNQPLIVIDGIIGGTLESLNTNDIATIDVLKDASATAIYGSRGANGVIVVNTKKGKGKPKIDFQYFKSIATAPKNLPVMTPAQFAALNNVEVIDGGVENYQDLYFETAILDNYQFSTSGRKNDISYFLSTGYVDQEGIVINSNYDRLSLRSNINMDFGERFKIGLNVFGSREQRFNTANGGVASGRDRRGGILGVLTWDNTVPLRNQDGSFTLESPNSLGNILINPVAVQLERVLDITQDRFNANLNLSYDITNSLNFNTIIGTVQGYQSTEDFQGIPDGSSVLPPRAEFSNQRLTTYQVSNILNWNKHVGKSNIKLTGVYELQNSINRITRGDAGSFAIETVRDAFYLLELGDDPRVRANKVEGTIQSYVGRAEYNWNDQFYMTGTLRIDQSSRFRKENRTGYFPSISGAYNFSNFLSEDSFVTNIKTRLGYGEIGNQNIAPLSTFTNLPANNDFAFDGTDVEIGLGAPVTVDENIKWETTKQINAGVDIGFFNNKLNLTIDWFQKNTTDLLLRKPIPGFSGGGTLLTNIGEVKNNGLDISVEGTLVSNKDFTWNLNANLSTVKNEIVDLGGQDQILTRPSFIGQNFNILKVGEPLGQFFGATFLGTWKTADAADGRVPGSPRYVLDEEGNPALDIIGNGIPKLTWGLNSSVSYKNFDVNLLFRGAHGFDIYNLTYSEMVRPNAGGSAIHPDFLDRWTPENQTEIPAVRGEDLVSSRFIEKGDFIRLANITLGYTIDSIKPFSAIRIYGSGQNLFTISDYRGYDPESSSSNVATGDASASIDYGAFPNPRTITFGFNVGF
ncbi:TonB-dependent receptor [Aquimarina sp. RZ0]|uniref:SusC/RagA family TonB-linked outer membrane protein n=1 Tax=Aquimarina sp. RZ0 TaxID=2607730 RepID=UPI00165F25B1|nr:TonB-dependent receptor [Aquimarina sp. RZ0]